MVYFKPVKPEDVPNFKEGHKGRVSYPLLKSFLESGHPLVQIDRKGMQQSLPSLTSSVGAYIRNHQLPIRFFIRDGEAYLLRTDLDEEGRAKPLDIDKIRPNNTSDLPKVPNVAKLTPATIKRKAGKASG